MKPRLVVQRGYTLVELMVALAIGVILIGAVIVVYLIQTQTYKTTNSQAGIQNAENAIAALVTPVIRAAGFVGCSNIQQTLTSNLNPGGPPPIGTLATPSMLFAYDANGTAGTGTLSITQDNPANDSNLTHWTPNLDASLLSQVLPGSDVLVMFGATPGSQPVAVTGIGGGGATLTVQDATGLAAGQFAAVSDCNAATIFQITGVTGSTLAHVAGGNSLDNTAATFVVNVDYQLIPVQQTAIYVAKGSGGQSVLTLAIYSGGVWTPSPLVPGVETMQVLYGIGAAGTGAISQYVPGSSALIGTNTVYSIRIAFLIEGQPGSASASNPTQFIVLGTTVNVPQDTRLRRVYEMTINLRNAL